MTKRNINSFGPFFCGEENESQIFSDLSEKHHTSFLHENRFQNISDSENERKLTKSEEN